MEYVIAIFPPVAVGVLFYFVMRLVFQADRREREQLAKMEQEYQRERESEEKISAVSESTERE